MEFARSDAWPLLGLVKSLGSKNPKTPVPRPCEMCKNEPEANATALGGLLL